MLVHFGLAPAAAAQALPLDEALRLAETNQPLLASQQAAMRAAGEMAISVKQLPDPQLKLGLINVPTTGPDAFSLTADFMTMRMVGVMQEFPREEKRRLKGQIAETERQGKELEHAFTRHAIRRDVAVAWTEAFYSQQALAIIAELQRETRRQIDSMTIAYRAGKIGQADVLAMRVELDLLGDRAKTLERDEALARAELARWIGAEAQRPLAASAPAAPEPPKLDDLLAAVEQHPHLLSFDKQVAVAQAQADLARAGTRPDWNLEVNYGFRGSQFSDMLTVQVGIDLPVFPKYRQTREVASRLATADQMRAMRADNLNEMRAQLRREYTDWQSARDRLANFRNVILPQARARVDAALAAYRAGRGELVQVLEARRIEVDLRMQALMLEAQAAKAAYRIGYFAQH
jgi:outer membrane protein TolC